MSARDLVRYVGLTVAVKERGYAWFARVEDARMNYGTLQFQVVPVAGIGTLWINADRTNEVQ